MNESLPKALSSFFTVCLIHIFLSDLLWMVMVSSELGYTNSSINEVASRYGYSTKLQVHLLGILYPKSKKGFKYSKGIIKYFGESKCESDI